MKFSGADIGNVKDLIVATFSVDELSELALRYLDINFDNEIAPGKYNKRALDFVIYTNHRNITCDFIRAAFTERPRVPEWQEFNKRCNAGPAVTAPPRIGLANDRAPAAMYDNKRTSLERRDRDHSPLHKRACGLRAPDLRAVDAGPCAAGAWRSMLRQIVEVASFTNAAVLLIGESGTGKELVARLVHDLDPRASGNELVILDCTTTAPELSGSEFFGHERGAFTGAVGARDGAFAAAMSRE
ncbi:MAG: anaerobic nitric oxide reductase transcription regulator [Bradyrhizobium sp.]|jgi:hypothetical protein|nr:anaerobic nitric oxide reductase transcription regulator [Bradyrhizobium sp.]